MNSRDINIYFCVSSNSWVRMIKAVGNEWIFDGCYGSKKAAEMRGNECDMRNM